jgi:SAM-dependent methyltransferase
MVLREPALGRPARGRAATDVYSLCLPIDGLLPAGLREAEREVEILVVEDESFVEAADLLIRVSACKRARRQDGLHGDETAAVLVERGTDVQCVDYRARPCEEVRVGFRARSSFVDECRTAKCESRVRIEPLREARDRIGADERVAVQEQEPLAGRRLDAGVHCGGKPTTSGLHDAYTWLGGDALDAAVGRSLIGDDDLIESMGGKQRVDAPLEEVAAVSVWNHGRDGHGSKSRSGADGSASSALAAVRVDSVRRATGLLHSTPCLSQNRSMAARVDSTLRIVRRGAARLLAAGSYRLNLLAKRIQVPRPAAAVAGGRTLAGDRDVEWAWSMAHVLHSDVPGRLLDLGAGHGMLSLTAAFRGHTVVAVDLEATAFQFEANGIEYLRGDFNQMAFEPASFDQVINCSTIEHFGLAGRYGSVADEDADLVAMERLADLLRPEGSMVLTIPVGRDGVFSPYHRVYGEERLPRLLDRFRIDREQYWAKPHDNRWTPVERVSALEQQGSASFYALGLFVLKPR